MVTHISHNAAETEALGAAWGQTARAGWLIGLTGELGAGKTQFVKGLARGLGIHERVHSPTFALVNEYHSGRLPLFHLDLYRLEIKSEIASAGLEEYFFQTQGVTVVEWFERWFKGIIPCSGVSSERRTFPNNQQRPDQRRSDETPLQGSEKFGLIPWRLVRFEVLNETDREITYEDLGA